MGLSSLKAYEFAFVLAVCCGTGVPMSENGLDYLLCGKTVTVSYVSDPSFGHGEFLIMNLKDDAMTARVLSVRLERDSGQIIVPEYHVYNRDQMKTEVNNEFLIASGEEATVLVGFPAVPYEPRFGDEIMVLATFKIDDREEEVGSVIKFERRIPLR